MLQASTPKAKRLLIVFYDLGVGGIQRRLVDIIEYLQTKSEGRNIEITLYIKSYSGNRHNREYIERIEKAGARIIYRPRWTMGPFRLATASHIIWTVVKFRPDVILTYLRLLSVGIVFMKKFLCWRNTKVVLNEGILTSALLEDEIPSRTRWIWKLLMEWAYPRADRVIVPTHAVKNDLVRNFNMPAENVIIVPHWTLISDTTIRPSSRRKPRYNLIYIGRLEPQKNIRMLLDIIKSLTKYHPKLRVCIVGTGSLETQLQKYAEELNIKRNLDIIGRQDDVFPYLRQSQIFILTSHYEGMPVSVLEAKAFGIPAVIADYLGAEEIVEDGKDGYICHTKEEFVKRISGLISDDNRRKRIGEFAKTRAGKEFGISVLKHFCSAVIEV